MNNPEKNIFVFGATGFIGIRLCAELHKKGYRVFASVRSGSDKNLISEYVKEYVTCDLINKNSVGNLVRFLEKNRIGNIIFSIGSVDYKQDYKSSKIDNIEPVKIVIDLAKKLRNKNKLRKIIFISSVAANGFFLNKPKKGEFIAEKTNLYNKGISVYSDVKKEVNDLIKNEIDKNNLLGIIVQPGSIVGRSIGNKSTTNVNLIKKIIKGFPVLKGGASYTSISRVVEGIIQIFEKGKIGQSYLLGGENMSMRDFRNLVKSFAKKDFPEITLSKIPNITLPQIFSFILGKYNIVLNKQQALLGNSFHYIDSSKAEKEVGYNHSIADLKMSITEILEEIKP